MKRLLAFLLCTSVSFAQTTITVPTASGGGIKTVLPTGPGGKVFGINLDDSFAYGNNQLAANLIATFGTNFAPQIASMGSTCASGTGSTWVDTNTTSPQPANFWQGATYQVISGADIGNTGTITSSAAATGSVGQTFHGTFTTGCAANADQIILRCTVAFGTCSGGYTPQATSLFLNTTGSGAINFEHSDVSPSSPSTQALQLVAPSTSTAQVLAPFDQNTAPSTSFYINLNGTYTLTFRAKGTTGAPVLTYTVERIGTTFTTGTVTPTVNGTAGAGWTNYSFNFTAGEIGSQSTTGEVIISATGGTALIQDMALTESPTGGNNTAFRNAVYQRLVALRPGILRFMTGSQWGCNFDNMISASPNACIADNFHAAGTPVSYNLNQFLTLAASIGADPWWTFSVYSTPTDMANIAAYMSGTCGNGNAYTTIRCNYGQTTPWTSVFNHIYLEMGNEIWNSPNGNNVWTGSGSAYGALLGTNDAAFKASSFYSSKMKLVGSGFVLQSSGSFGWNNTVLTAAKAVTNGLPDYIDGAPYLFSVMTDVSSNANLFGPMFTEPVNRNTLTSGDVYNLQNYTSTNFAGVNGAEYETNLGTQCGIAGVSQSTIDNVVAGVGSGLDTTLNMLLGVRDAGVYVQNFFSLPEVGNTFFTAPSTTTGTCSTNGNPLYSPLWGANRIMPGPTNSGTVDRPEAITLQMVNVAMLPKLLNVTQSGTPTYNQAAAQPVPQSGGTPAMNIAANAAVPYVQAFGFGDGAGNYSLIVYNLNLTSTEAITFSGAAAPSGTVTKTVFTSTNITDNNESVVIGGTPVVTQPSSTTVSSPSGDTLPAFSMTTYSWSSSTPPTIPTRNTLVF